MGLWDGWVHHPRVHCHSLIFSRSQSPKPLLDLASLILTAVSLLADDPPSCAFEFSKKSRDIFTSGGFEPHYGGVLRCGLDKIRHGVELGDSSETIGSGIPDVQ